MLAVDVGTRFIRAALGDLAGNIRARRDVPFIGTDLDSTIATVASLCDELVDDGGGARLDGAVVGVPGVVDPVDGSVSLASNAAGIEGANFADRLTDALGVAVQLENDINLAALGEQWRGVARGVDDFLFLSIGTGMGAGLVLRRELHRGRNGAAGELDYAFVGVGPDADPSAAAVAGFAQELASRHSGVTSLLPPFEPRPIFAAARAGDRLARDIVAEEARRIGLHVLPVAAVADVELVVLGGGIGANGDLLLEPIRELLARCAAVPAARRGVRAR